LTPNASHGFPFPDVTYTLTMANSHALSFKNLPSGEERRHFPPEIHTQARRLVRENTGSTSAGAVSAPANWRNFLDFYKTHLEFREVLARELLSIRGYLSNSDDRLASAVTRNSPHVTVIEFQDVTPGRIMLSVSLDTFARVPPIVVLVPFTYPQQAPQYRIGKEYDTFLPECKSQFEARLRMSLLGADATSGFSGSISSISSIITTWKVCVLEEIEF